jgi:hypothetical protein
MIMVFSCSAKEFSFSLFSGLGYTIAHFPFRFFVGHLDGSDDDSGSQRWSLRLAEAF